MFAMHPQQFARRRIQGDHVPARSSSGVNYAVRHQRCSFEVEFRARAEVVRLESPGHLELAEIGGVDLVERRVVRVPKVSAVSPPLSVRRSGLRAERQRRPQHTCRQDQTRKHPPHAFLLTVNGANP